MTKILSADQATGSVFRPRRNDPHCIALEQHAGGTWILEMKTGNGNWVPVDGYEWTADATQILEGPVAAEFRLNGGAMGAEAFITALDGGDVALP